MYRICTHRQFFIFNKNSKTWNCQKIYELGSKLWKLFINTKKTHTSTKYFFWSTKTNVSVWIVCIKRRGYSFKVKMIYRKISNFWKFVIGTAWKVSIFGFILVHIFPHSDWIQTRITPNTDIFYAVWFIWNASSGPQIWQYNM